MRSVAFSADDRLLASGGEDQTIKVWNVDSHDLRGTLTGHTDIVSAVAFAQETLVSTELGPDDSNLGRRGSRATLETHRRTQRGGGNGGRAGWPPAAHRQRRPILGAVEVDGRRGPARSVRWANTAPSRGPPRFRPTEPAWPSPPADLAWSPTTKPTCYLYDLATKAEKYQVTFPGSVRSIAFAPAGDVLALGFARKSILLVDAATGREVAELEAQPADAPPAAAHSVHAGGVLARRQIAGRHLERQRHADLRRRAAHAS